MSCASACTRAAWWRPATTWCAPRGRCGLSRLRSYLRLLRGQEDPDRFFLERALVIEGVGTLAAAVERVTMQLHTIDNLCCRQPRQRGAHLDEPVADNSSEAGRARNRCVELFLRNTQPTG